VKRLELFGSGARDDFHPGRSDVDLLVEFLPDYGGRSPAENYFGLLSALEETLGHRVDLAARRAIRNGRFWSMIRPDLQCMYEAQPAPAAA
jgi:predicted nucleotidyltransferase